MTVLDELERLASLRKKGVITKEEFDIEKNKILSPHTMVVHQEAKQPVWLYIFCGFSLAVLLFVVALFIAGYYEEMAEQQAITTYQLKIN